MQQSDNCPFCSSPSLNKEVAEELSAQYESASVKTLSALREAIEGLRNFFVAEHLEQLREVTRSIDGTLSQEQESFLANLRVQVEAFLAKLTDLKTLSFTSLRNETDVAQAIQRMKIDTSLLHSLNSEETQRLVEGFNGELDHVAGRILEIKKGVGVQRSQIAKSIKQHQGEINEYLASAGYKYRVRMEEHGESYRMILEHEDAPGSHLEAAGSHLSYGERNAFALVLFMHQVRRNGPDLVILDDPVSSFDKTKKFAILHKLFHGKSSLREFTTLLLTHDIEPAIDVIRTGVSGQFTYTRPAVCFLQNRGGLVAEKVVKPQDIMTFSQVCKANIASSTDSIIKCIYLRRLYEIHGNRGSEYDVLSSLLHARDEPTRKGTSGKDLPLASAEKELAFRNICVDIPEFNYDDLLHEMREPGVLKEKFDSAVAGYEKVQIFRIASEVGGVKSSADPAFSKFVNETYHIENEYVMQLNPREFDAVPDHIIRSCEELFAPSE